VTEPVRKIANRVATHARTTHEIVAQSRRIARNVSGSIASVAEVVLNSGTFAIWLPNTAARRSRNICTPSTFVAPGVATAVPDATTNTWTALSDVMSVGSTYGVSDADGYVTILFVAGVGTTAR